MSEAYKHCNECGNDFENSFELIDHLLKDDEDFDPYYLLPNGIKLMVGSFLRFIYHHRFEPEQIETITQSTYVTLFATEMGYEFADDLIEDMVVESSMHNLDGELEKLLRTDDEKGK